MTGRKELVATPNEEESGTPASRYSLVAYPPPDAVAPCLVVGRVICGVVNGLHVGEDTCDMACFVRKSAPVSTANYYSVLTDIGDTSALQRDSGMHTTAGGGYTSELGHRDVHASICIVREKNGEFVVNPRTR